MNYRRHYDLLIERAKNRIIEGYQEKHHIIPKCIDGVDDKSNLVGLTPEEHFFAHILLIKIYPGNDALVRSINKMCRGHKGKRTRKLYGWLKRRYSQVQSKKMTGSGNPHYGKRWINDGRKSFRIGKKEKLPFGMFEGRICWYDKHIKNKEKRERIEQIKLEKINLLNLNAEKRLSSEKTGRNYRKKLSDNEIILTLKKNNFDVKLSMAELGYSLRGGNTRERFLKLKNNYLGVDQLVDH